MIGVIWANRSGRYSARRSSHHEYTPHSLPQFRHFSPRLGWDSRCVAADLRPTAARGQA